MCLVCDSARFVALRVHEVPAPLGTMEVRQSNVLLRECECGGAPLESRLVEQNGALLEEDDRETLIRAERTLVEDLE